MRCDRLESVDAHGLDLDIYPVDLDCASKLDAVHFRLLGHPVAEIVAVDRLDESGEVRDLVRCRDVAAGHRRVDDDDVDMGLREIDSSRESRGSTAENHDVGFSLYGSDLRVQFFDAGGRNVRVEIAHYLAPENSPGKTRADAFAVPEEEKGRAPRDAETLREFAVALTEDFVELHVLAVDFAEGLELRGERFAGEGIRSSKNQPRQDGP